METVCQHRTCVSGQCGMAFTTAGTPAGGDTAGDCHTRICDGQGTITPAVDDSDKPVDGNPCTGDVCTLGVPSNPPLVGAICATDGTKACDTTGTCAALTFRVVRVGDGGAVTSAASAAVFIEEHRLNGNLVGTVALPTAASGANQPLTISSTANSEGALALSASGHYLTLAGYATPPGTGSIAGSMSATIPRVAGRIDVNGAIDTSTRFAVAEDGNNVRSAVTSDGNTFWIAGTAGSNSNTGGVWSNTLGATAGETHVVSNPDNCRWLQIFGGQLYGSSGSGNFANVFTIGSGLPTDAAQTATTLPGLALTGNSPYGFVLFDLDGTVAGLDTLYIADDKGGVQKWTFDGVIWTLASTFGPAVRGLAGYVSGGTVTLMASTAETGNNHLVVFTDDGSSTPVGSTVATSPTNTLYRGVALSPHF
jgi:hypothetical protein